MSARSSAIRTRVANGKIVLADCDGRGLWARRFKEVFAEIISDLGGDAAGLSEGQRQLARRCATISIECESLESKAANGEGIDLELYGTLTDRLGRTFSRLGLRRVPHNITPDLNEYLRAETRTSAARRRTELDGTEDEEAEP